MALNYTTYQTALASLAVTSASNADFQTILPNVIDYAEQRIYRELDLVSTIVRDSSAAFVPLSRNFALPHANGQFVTVQEVNVITPISTAPDSGTRNQLTATTKEFLDATWNSVTGAGVPRWFNLFDQSSLIVGPWPDLGYTVEVVGTIRPAPLSATNTTTFLTLYLPDLFLAASMVFMSAWMRNFGSQADDPRMSQSWEAQTQTLMASAKNEETRKRFAGLSWSGYSEIPPVAEK